jgi:hypothetical protein
MRMYYAAPCHRPSFFPQQGAVAANGRPTTSPRLDASIALGRAWLEEGCVRVGGCQRQRPGEKVAEVVRAMR